MWLTWAPLVTGLTVLPLLVCVLDTGEVGLLRYCPPHRAFLLYCYIQFGVIARSLSWLLSTGGKWATLSLTCQPGPYLWGIRCYIHSLSSNIYKAEAIDNGCWYQWSPQRGYGHWFTVNKNHKQAVATNTFGHTYYHACKHGKCDDHVCMVWVSSVLVVSLRVLPCTIQHVGRGTDTSTKVCPHWERPQEFVNNFGYEYRTAIRFFHHSAALTRWFFWSLSCFYMTLTLRKLPYLSHSNLYYALGKEDGRIE